MANLHTRGCSPHGLARDRREPVGSIMGTRVQESLPGGGETSCYAPVLLVTVATGAYKPRRAFLRFCQLNDIDVRIAHETRNARKAKRGTGWGQTTVFEATASTDRGLKALEELSVHPSVISWAQPLNVSAPRLGFRSAATQATPLPRRKKTDVRVLDADRLAKVAVQDGIDANVLKGTEPTDIRHSQIGINPEDYR